MKRFYSLIENMVEYLEIGLAIFVILSVLVGSIDLFKILYGIIFLPPDPSYQEFQALLGHLLLLVVGLELVVMLVKHTPGSVLEVLLFAIARKLLIATPTMFDFFVGILAIAALFAIRKFLFVTKINDLGGVFPGSTPIKEVNRAADVHIPESIAATLDELLSLLIKDPDDLAVDNIFKINDAKLTILAMEQDRIDLVRVTKLSS